jgi:hypothetical protein
MAGGPNGSVYINGLVREPMDGFWEVRERWPLNPCIPNMPIELGDTFTQSVAPTTTPSASVNSVRVTLKSILASVTPTFSIATRWASQVISIASTPVVAIVRRLNRSLTPTTTPTFSIIKSTSRTLGLGLVSYPYNGTSTITNPGAETGDATGWTNIQGTASPTARAASPAPHSGSWYFMSGTGASNWFGQTLTVPSDLLNDVDAGLLTATVSVYRNEFAVGNDEGQVTLDCYDGSNNWLCDAMGPFVGYTTWTKEDLTIWLPPGTRSIRIGGRGNAASGNDDAYFDDWSIEYNKQSLTHRQLCSIDGSSAAGWTSTTGTIGVHLGSGSAWTAYANTLYGGTTVQCIAHQDFAVSANEIAAVDAGIATVKATFMLGGFSGDDKVRVWVECLDVSNAVLATIQSSAATVAYGNYFADEFFDLSTTVPSGTRTIRLNYQSDRVVGTANDGYALHIAVFLAAVQQAQYLPANALPAIVKSISRLIGITSTDTATIARRTNKALSLAADVSAVIVRATGKIIALAADVVATLTPSGSVGHTYSQTVAIDNTPSFSIVKSTAHAISVAASVAMSIIRSTGKRVSYAADVAASIARATSRAITSSSTPSSAVSRSTGHTIGGEADSSQTISRSSTRAAGANAGTTQSINRSISRTLALAASVSATISRLISRAIGSSTTPTSEVGRAPGRNVSASASSAQAISRATARTTAADATTAQAVTKATSRTMAQDANGSAGLISTRAFLRTIETTVSTLQALVRAIARALSPTAGTTTSVSRANSRTIQHSVATSFSISRLIGRIMRASSVPNAKVVKSSTRRISAVTNPAADLQRTKGLFVTKSIDTMPTLSVIRRISRTLGAAASGIASLLHIGPSIRQAVAGFLNRSKSADAQTRSTTVDAHSRSVSVSAVTVRSITVDANDREIDTSRRIE